MDKLKQIPARFLEIWKSWSRNQKIIIVSAVAVFIAAVVVIAVVLSRPTYQELTRCEDYNELNAGVLRLPTTPDTPSLKLKCLANSLSMLARRL